MFQSRSLLVLWLTCNKSRTTSNRIENKRNIRTMFSNRNRVDIHNNLESEIANDHSDHTISQWTIDFLSSTLVLFR
jgi:hypothetical protein